MCEMRWASVKSRISGGGTGRDHVAKSTVGKRNHKASAKHAPQSYIW